MLVNVAQLTAEQVAERGPLYVRLPNPEPSGLVDFRQWRDTNVHSKLPPATEKLTPRSIDKLQHVQQPGGEEAGGGGGSVPPVVVPWPRGEGQESLEAKLPVAAAAAAAASAEEGGEARAHWALGKRRAVAVETRWNPHQFSHTQAEEWSRATKQRKRSTQGGEASTQETELEVAVASLRMNGDTESARGVAAALLNCLSKEHLVLVRQQLSVITPASHHS